MRYLAVIEKRATGYGAHVPDLPGCVAAADTRDEVLALIKEAIEFHGRGCARKGNLSLLLPQWLSWWKSRQPDIRQE